MFNFRITERSHRLRSIEGENRLLAALAALVLPAAPVELGVRHVESPLVRASGETSLIQTPLRFETTLSLCILSTRSEEEPLSLQHHRIICRDNPHTEHQQIRA